MMLDHEEKRGPVPRGASAAWRLVLVAVVTLLVPRSAPGQTRQPLAPAPSVDGQDGPRTPDGRVFDEETTAEQLTFAESVRRALSRNPTAVQAQEEVRRFHALMEQVRAS